MGDNGIQKGKGGLQTCIKGTWMKPKGTGEGIVGRRVFRNYYKGHMEKTKGDGGSRGWRWVWLG